MLGVSVRKKLVRFTELLLIRSNDEIVFNYLLKIISIIMLASVYNCGSCFCQDINMEWIGSVKYMVLVTPILLKC